MSFTEKKIETRIKLNIGAYKSGDNVKIITGLPTEVNISQAGFPSLDQAKISIFGINQEDLESLTFLSFKTLYYTRNEIEVYAGDDEGMSLVFQGDIINSKPDYNSAPDVPLVIDAISGYYQGLSAVPPYTFKGSIPTSNIIEELCQQMGYTFVNEGETKKAVNPYLKGSPIQKIMQLAKSYNLDVNLTGKTVTLRKSDGNRRLIASINKDSGLIGYPEFTNMGLKLNCEFMPELKIGDEIEVKSIVPKASGRWRIFSLNHSIGVHLDGAPWETSIECIYPVGL